MQRSSSSWRRISVYGRGPQLITPPALPINSNNSSHSHGLAALCARLICCPPSLSLRCEVLLAVLLAQTSIAFCAVPCPCGQPIYASGATRAVHDAEIELAAWTYRLPSMPPSALYAEHVAHQTPAGGGGASR